MSSHAQIFNASCYSIQLPSLSVNYKTCKIYNTYNTSKCQNIFLTSFLFSRVDTDKGNERRKPIFKPRIVAISWSRNQKTRNRFYNECRLDNNESSKAVGPNSINSEFSKHGKFFRDSLFLPYFSCNKKSKRNFSLSHASLFGSDQNRHLSLFRDPFDKYFVSMPFISKTLSKLCSLLLGPLSPNPVSNMQNYSLSNERRTKEFLEKVEKVEKTQERDACSVSPLITLKRGLVLFLAIFLVCSEAQAQSLDEIKGGKEIQKEVLSIMSTHSHHNNHYHYLSNHYHSNHYHYYRGFDRFEDKRESVASNVTSRNDILRRHVSLGHGIITDDIDARDKLEKKINGGEKLCHMLPVGDVGDVEYSNHGFQTWQDRGGKEDNLWNRQSLFSELSLEGKEENISNSQSLFREPPFENKAKVALSIDYSKLVQEHGDLEKKMGMFTQDAWKGMLRLKEYDMLVEKLEGEEKGCIDCIKNRRLLEQIWQTVSNEYFDQYGNFSQAMWSRKLTDVLKQVGGPLRTKAQTYWAAKQMVATLGDQWSAFLDPAQYRIAIHRPIPSEIKYLAYQYTGIGIELGPPSPYGGLKIIAPFAGSPAEEEGVVGGERLLSVNKTPVSELTSDEAVTLLRGPVGSTVEIEVAGPQEGETSRFVSLERRALPLPPMKTKLINSKEGGQVAYIRLHYFTHEGRKQMETVIREGEALGVDGYILDLRNNPGGVFEEAISMAGLWLDCGECDVTETVRSVDSTNSTADIEDYVYQQGHFPREVFGNHPGALTHAPLILIINRSSASASEVLTGALRDNQRVIVIGEKTFGKGVVQYYFPMDDGSGLKLTVAKYLTPSRYDISKEGGILPDIECSDHPQAKGIDQCTKKAIDIISNAQENDEGENKNALIGEGPFGRMAYRWLPSMDRRLWAKSYE